MASHVGKAVKAAFGKTTYKDGASKAAHWLEHAACIGGSERAAAEWSKMVTASLERMVCDGRVSLLTCCIQELHRLEMMRDGTKLQAGTDQAEMVAKAARSVGLQVPDKS